MIQLMNDKAFKAEAECEPRASMPTNCQKSHCDPMVARFRDVLEHFAVSHDLIYQTTTFNFQINHIKFSHSVQNAASLFSQV
jgi:hypothetical protein